MPQIQMPAMRIWQAFLIAAAPGKVLKMDRPAAGGFVSLTALRAEGCGGGFAAIFKVSVTGFAFWIRWHDKHYDDEPPSVAFPPFGALRHHLPAPLGSVSHDSQVALLPYESCSLATAVSVGRQKESAFMGRLGALLRPTCTSYAGCAQWTIKLRKAIPSLNA